MGCIYSDFNGKCSLYTKEIDMPCCKEGFCECEEDPNPEESCDWYESDENKDEDDEWG